jgi:HAD superfamily hydrolase (TIGR01509 family)
VIRVIGTCISISLDFLERDFYSTCSLDVAEPGENQMLSAVIFDFDGIIVDTEPLHYRAFQAVLNPQEKGFSWERYCTNYLGLADRDAFKMIFRAKKESVGPNELERLVAAKARAFLQYVNEESITPYPGAVELILSLSKQLPVALCSGGTSRDICPIIEKLGIRSAFSTVVTAEDTPKSKPDPAPYLLAIRNLGLADAATVVAIEDTAAGIASATGAGLKVLAVTNSFARERLLASDAVIETLESVNRQSIEDMFF